MSLICGEGIRRFDAEKKRGTEAYKKHDSSPGSPSGLGLLEE